MPEDGLATAQAGSMCPDRWSGGERRSLESHWHSKRYFFPFQDVERYFYKYISMGRVTPLLITSATQKWLLYFGQRCMNHLPFSHKWAIAMGRQSSTVARPLVTAPCRKSLKPFEMKIYFIAQCAAPLAWHEYVSGPPSISIPCQMASKPHT